MKLAFIKVGFDMIVIQSTFQKVGNLAYNYQFSFDHTTQSLENGKICLRGPRSHNDAIHSGTHFQALQRPIQFVDPERFPVTKIARKSSCLSQHTKLRSIDTPDGQGFPLLIATVDECFFPAMVASQLG